MNVGLLEFAKGLASDTREFVTERIKATADPLAAKLDALERRNTELERRVTELEARPLGLKYCGVWEQRTYAVGDVVSQNGMWVCLTQTRMRPGESRDWQLAIRNGRDGRDLR